MSTLIMNAADPVYGILSCNYTTSKLKNLTMSEVAKKDTGKITGQDDGFIQASKKRRDAVHMSKVPIPAPLAKLNPSVAREQIVTGMRRDMALDAYLDEFPELRQYADIESMTDPERTTLADILLGKWRSGKMESVIPRTHDAISEAPNELKLADGVSIADHTRNDIAKDKKRLINGLVDSMSKSISIRLTEPDFVKALLTYDVDETGMLPFTTPEAEDEDVLEQLNIRLLSRVRISLSEYDVGALINEDEDVMMKVIRSILRLVIRVKLEMSDETPINDAFVRAVLDSAFPGCDKAPIIPGEIHPLALKVISGSRGFEDIDARVIWEFFTGFALAYEMKLPQSRNESKEEKQFKTILSTVKEKIRMGGLNDIASQASRIRAGGATIYTINGCKWCKLAKAVVLGYGFKDVPIEKYGVPDDVIAKINGKVTYPIVMVGDDYIGGFTELDALLKKTPVQRRPTMRMRGFAPRALPMARRAKTTKAVAVAGVAAASSIVRSLESAWEDMLYTTSRYGYPIAADIGNRFVNDVTKTLKAGADDVGQRVGADSKRAFDEIQARIMRDSMENIQCGLVVAIDGGSKEGVFEMVKKELNLQVGGDVPKEFLHRHITQVARALGARFLRPILMERFDRWVPDMELDIVIARRGAVLGPVPTQNMATLRSITCGLASSDGMINFWKDGSDLIDRALACDSEKSLAASCPMLSRDLYGITDAASLSIDASVAIAADTTSVKLANITQDTGVAIATQGVLLVMFMIVMLARRLVLGVHRRKAIKSRGYAPSNVDADIDRLIARFSV